MSARIYGWDEFDGHAKSIADRVRRSDFEPTGIFGVPRGGLPLAVKLSHLLSVPLLLAPVRGCIVADDIADTGNTLLPFHHKGFKLATLLYKPCSKIPPDFYGDSHLSDDWVFFPWEAR